MVKIGVHGSKRGKGKASIPMIASPRRIRPATGSALRCKGWRQEGLLRLLENTVANGERPEDLVIYGGTAQAARDWACFEEIVHSLKALRPDETLVIQSGNFFNGSATT